MSGLTYNKEVPDALQGAWKLTDLEISFVSACPQGANPGAKVMLKKEFTPMPAKKNFAKEGQTDKPVNVTVDVEAIGKSISENLKKSLSEMLAKDKDLSADVISETVVAVVTGDIAKMAKDVNTQLSTQLADFQKSVDKQIADASASAKVDKSLGDDEVLTLNGTSFKKSAVGEHAFAAIKASAMEVDAIRKEAEHSRVVARVEKEYPNVAGKAEDKASLLILIEKADDAVKAMGLSVLKALNDAGGDFKKEQGRTSGEHNAPLGKMSTDTDASAKLDTMAKDLAAKEGIPLATAYTKVLDTPEGDALYNQHRGD